MESSSKSPTTRTPAYELPVARVLPLLGVPHLDRYFDYLVEEQHSSSALVGARVRIRFSGRLVDAFIVERRTDSDHTGTLSYLHRIISAEAVLTPEIALLVNEIAQLWCGVRSDVLRLAVPPRHAQAEKSVPLPVLGPNPPPVVPTGDTTYYPLWQQYERGHAFLAALRAGRLARAAWLPLPGESWPHRVIEAAESVAAGGRSTLVLVPDQRDIDSFVAAVAALPESSELTIGTPRNPGTVVALSAGLGPAERYRRWLRILRGQVLVVVGTRSAVFAPLPRPGLICIWDDGDASFAEPRAPYWNTRDVAVLRSHLSDIPLLLSGTMRTPEVQRLVESGWAPEIAAPRPMVRNRAPQVTALSERDPTQQRAGGADHARVPARASAIIRAALARDEPVLVQVPRRGYAPALACAQCRTPARCRTCSGPLRSSAAGPLAESMNCGWCSVPEVRYRCPQCGGDTLRASVIGSARTAEELGRMFPSIAVHTSGGSTIVDSVPAVASLVICTPGAEPAVENGYGAAILLDAWALLGREDLRTVEDALRRWFTAATQVKSREDGGEIYLSADSEIAAAQALIRWDPSGWASQELADRREVRFPPTVHFVAIDGPAVALERAVDHIEFPAGVEVLGPVDVPTAALLAGRTVADGDQRMLIRCSSSARRAVCELVRTNILLRADIRHEGPFRIHVDPLYIG